MKEYRQNSHVWSLVFWSLLCSATATFCFVHSHHLISRRLRIEECLAGGGMFLVPGPAALAAYLVRARMVWVGLEEDGLRVSSRRTIAWEEIREVRRRRPLLRSGSGPAQAPGFDAGEVLRNTGGCVDPGCITGLGEFFVAVLIVVAFAFAVWFIVFVFVPLVIIPVLEVFVPFGDVIRVRARGGTLVLRDLSAADEFMPKVRERVRVVAE